MRILENPDLQVRAVVATVHVSFQAVDSVPSLTVPLANVDPERLPADQIVGGPLDTQDSGELLHLLSERL
jgi:hypothetical protein